MQQNNIAKHMYSEVYRKPKPDVLQEKALEICLWAVTGFVNHMADVS